MVDCRATTYSRLSEDHELTLFRAAGSLRIPGQTASVTGLETMNINQATDYFQAITGPQSVFITAMAWDMIDMAKHYTKIANRLTLRGDYDRARARYWNIIHLPVKEGILFTSPPAIYTSDAAGPAVVFSRILHDAAASYGLLSLRALNTVEAEIGEEYSHRLCAFLSGFDDRDQILGFADQPRATWLVVSGAWHLSLLLMAAKATSISDIDDVLLKFQDLRERRPRSKHVAHDIAQLRDVRENCESADYSSSAFARKMIEQSSACALPPRVFNFKVPDHITRPEIVGWTVMDQAMTASPEMSTDAAAL